MAEPHEMNYCPQCGQTLSNGFRFGKQRRVCEACGFVYFRDPKVAVVVFIPAGNRILMVQRAANPGQGKWALPAGYIDYGEDPRAAGTREVREETGLEIRITRLIDVLGPDPSGENPASIVILFEGERVGGTLKAADDARQVVFFTPDEIPLADIAFESTRRLIERWMSTQTPETSPLED